MIVAMSGDVPPTSNTGPSLLSQVVATTPVGCPVTAGRMGTVESATGTLWVPRSHAATTTMLANSAAAKNARAREQRGTLGPSSGSRRRKLVICRNLDAPDRPSMRAYVFATSSDVSELWHRRRNLRWYSATTRSVAWHTHSISRLSSLRMARFAPSFARPRESDGAGHSTIFPIPSSR